MEKPEEKIEKEILQVNMTKVKKFFDNKQERKIEIANTPWITAAVGTELQRLLKEGIIRDGMRVLEIGCSIGVESSFLAKHGMNVTGVDFVSGTIEIAKEYAELVGANVEYICADFLELKTDGLEGTFDLIFDQGCFHHFPINDRDKYAKKVSTLLKKEGLFFLRSFSNRMIPSPTNDGPWRVSSDDINDTFHKYFITEHLYLFNNLPLPNPSSYKPQVFWSYLGRNRG
jgi:2-polyprenyl-3-methyl-5-hydroxy-6-metoxy-1,4-benzoquinol methylase